MLIIFFLQGVMTEAEENGIGITDFSVLQSRINPKTDRLTTYFFLSKNSPITLKVFKGNRVIATLINDYTVNKGPHVFPWDAKVNGRLIEEGKYIIQIKEGNFTKSVPIEVSFLNPPKITTLNIWPKTFSPSGVSPRKSQGIFFSASEKGNATIQILQNGSRKRTIFNKEVQAGNIQQLWWDGKLAGGELLQPGNYDVKVTITNKKGSHSLAATSKIIAYDSTPGEIANIQAKIKGLYDKGKIDYKRYSHYRSIIDQSAQLLSRLKSSEKRQEYVDLSYVVGQIANSGQLLEKSHNYLIDINLAKNLNYYSKNVSPKPWRSFENLDDTFVYIYFRDRGLQPHPVASLVRISKDRDDGHFLKSLNKILSYYTPNKHAGKEFKTILYQFEYMGGPSFWPSAMSQGMVLPSIARAYRLTGKKHYLEEADRIMNSFSVDHKHGGVLDRGESGKDTWYLEYAFSSSLKVLNGSLISLQGLKSYANLTGDRNAEKLFRLGLAQIAKDLHVYDVNTSQEGSWSKYCNIQYPASDHYHVLNTILVEWAAKNKKNISRGEVLDYFAKNWRQQIVKLSKLKPGRFDETKVLEGLVQTYDYEAPSLYDKPLF